MTDNTYNGWTTFETWQASLWLSEADTLGRLQEDRWKRVDAEDVETFVYEIMNDHESTGLLGDIVNSWISCVNFHEIADHLNEDLEG
jgi:hypothetical protein